MMEGPVFRRSDGGYDVTLDGAIYGPIFRTPAPTDKVTWEEVEAYIEGHPEEVFDQTLPAVELSELKRQLRSRIDTAIPDIRKAGFDFGGVLYQADPGVTEAVNGIQTALSRGWPVAFPLKWRSGDNDRPSFSDQAAFDLFSQTLLGFVNGLYKRAFDTKDAIEAASTVESAQAAFYSGGWV